MSLTSAKIRIRKILPLSIFNAGLFVWRNSVQKILQLIGKIKLLGFKAESTVTLRHHDAEFKIIINPHNGFIDEYIYLNGVYEDYILNIIAEYLPENGVLFDVGANIGQHSLFAAAFLKNQGQVYGFEPVPALFQQFSKSVELNSFDNIKLYNIACGNASSSGQIHLNYANAGQASLIELDQTEEVVSVQVIKLDDLFPDLNELSFIKIDVEGYEYEVLLGTKELISRTKPVILLEFSPIIYNKTDPGVSEKILDFLMNQYDLTDIDDGGYLIKNKQEYMTSFIARNRPQSNILCLPKN